MKRIAWMAVLMVLAWNTAVQAQEREPLAMRIMLDWTLGGVFVGALVGAGIWLTDPGKEGNRISDQVLSGASWGAVAGMIMGINTLNTNLIPPIASLYPVDPLHPARRITSNTIAEEEARQNLLASASRGHTGGPPLVFQVLNYRF